MFALPVVLPPLLLRLSAAKTWRRYRSKRLPAAFPSLRLHNRSRHPGSAAHIAVQANRMSYLICGATQDTGSNADTSPSHHAVSHE